MSKHENEFNEVKIINEEGVENFEFGSTPKADSTSYEDNKDKLRDEVNDNPVSNSDVKDEEKKEQKKKDNSSSKGNKSHKGSHGSMASSVAVAAASAMVVVGSLSALIGLSPVEPAPGPEPEPTPTPSNICTITFDPADGSGEMAPVQVEKGSKYVTPECEFTPPDWWFTFRGWNIPGVSSSFVPAGYTVTIKNDVTFTAVYYEQETNILTFDANGGTGTMEPVRIIHLETFTFPECEFIAPEGQEFSCWKGSFNEYLEFQPGDTWDIFDDYTIIAQWKDIESGTNEP